MKKLVFLVGLFVCLSLLTGCSLKKAPAALQISTTPVANVFVDGKLVGKTPYQSSNLKAGEISLKLIPESATSPLSSWEGKIKLNNGVLTLIDREFSSSETGSSGQVMTLEKLKDKKVASLSLISDPDGALVHLDGEAKGFTPLALEKIGVGDHQIVVSKEGFVEKNIKAKAVEGFKLIINVKLAQEMEEPVASLSGTPTPTVTGTGKKPTPTPTGSEKSQPASGEVLIKETPTGWLRVRSTPSTSGTELAKVNPGEKYPLLEEKSGWYKIEYEEGKTGWISGQYASKL
jgi:hypothetical protein